MKMMKTITKTITQKTNLLPHLLTFSVIIVTIADMSTTIAPNTYATIVMSTHLDIQYRIAIMLVIIEARVFNHSRGIML